MSNSVRSYLAGLCHGMAAIWIVGYILYKSSIPLDRLYNPKDGILPVFLAVPLVIGGNLLIQLNVRARSMRERAVNLPDGPREVAATAAE